MFPIDYSKPQPWMTYFDQLQEQTASSTAGSNFSEDDDTDMSSSQSSSFPSSFSSSNSLPKTVAMDEKKNNSYSSNSNSANSQYEPRYQPEFNSIDKIRDPKNLLEAWNEFYKPGRDLFEVCKEIARKFMGEISHVADQVTKGKINIKLGIKTSATLGIEFKIKEVRALYQAIHEYNHPTDSKKPITQNQFAKASRKRPAENISEVTELEAQVENERRKAKGKTLVESTSKSAPKKRKRGRDDHGRFAKVDV